MDNDQEEVNMPQTELEELLSEEKIEEEVVSEETNISKEIREEFDNSELFD